MRGEDVRKILLDGGYKLKSVADELSISPQALNSKFKTKNITIDALTDIARAINKDVDFFLKQSIETNAKEITDLNFMQVPFVPIYAQGGYPKGYGDMEYIESLPTIPVIVDKNYRGKYRVFEVAGDSMDDSSRNALYDGDKILCREVKRELWSCKLHIKKYLFVVVHKIDGITVKQITEHNVETGDILCHPLNPIFEDFSLNLNDVAELYNVIKIVDRNTRI